MLLSLCCVIASFAPVRNAVAAVVSPVPLETVLSLGDLPAVTKEETEIAKQELEKELEWDLVQQDERQKGRDYADHVDAILGLDELGLVALLEQEIVSRKGEISTPRIQRPAKYSLRKRFFTTHMQ